MLEYNPNNGGIPPEYPELSHLNKYTLYSTFVYTSYKQHYTARRHPYKGSGVPSNYD